MTEAMRAAKTLDIRGVQVLPGYLDAAAQARLLAAVRQVLEQAPLFRPVTPRGRPMSVRISAAGTYGWISDRKGYRYARRHPEGMAWPPIPGPARAIWQDLVDSCRLPDCCLINHYGEGARMGLHQDRDEADFGWPVLSVSLGDDGLFRVGSVARGGRTESLWLRSGDVAVMGGAARLVHHGVDRIRFGSSGLLAEGGRLNLTMRVVD